MTNISIALIIIFLSLQGVSAAETLTKAADVKSAYTENIVSLKDLTGVYVVLDYVISSSEKSHLSVNPNLQQEVKKRLENAGLKLLNKEEMLQTPGNPELDIFPTYPAHLSATPQEPGPEAAIANLSPSHPCCYSSVWGSFSQGAVLERKSGNKYRFSTWGNGSNTTSCENLGEWMGDATLKIIDNFVADFKKAKETKLQQEKQTIVTSEKTGAVSSVPQTQVVQIKEANDTKGMTCDTALIIYAEIFKTGSSTIGNAKGNILDNLITHMLSCKNYRYRIETHSDQRASHEANELLSARRAIAIHNYLVDKGVDEEQFEMRFFGDRKPISKGNTEEDYAANRRVEITPIKQQ